MTRGIYDLTIEPKGDVYRRLLSGSLQYCTILLLVTRHSIGLNDSGEELLRRLDPFLLSKTEELEWPGTKLFGHTATVFRFNLSPDTSSILASTADSLFDWLQPGLPEDPCLLRTDGAPWLVTISHEKDAYLELSSEERESFAYDLPDVSLRLRPQSS